MEEILDAVVAERSTFTRADVAEKIAEMMPAGAVSHADVLATIEPLADNVVAPDLSDVTEAAWPVTPEKEGVRKFVCEALI